MWRQDSWQEWPRCGKLSAKTRLIRKKKDMDRRRKDREEARQKEEGSREAKSEDGSKEKEESEGGSCRGFGSNSPSRVRISDKAHDGPPKKKQQQKNKTKMQRERERETPAEKIDNTRTPARAAVRELSEGTRPVLRPPKKKERREERERPADGGKPCQDTCPVRREGTLKKSRPGVSPSSSTKTTTKKKKADAGGVPGPPREGTLKREAPEACQGPPGNKANKKA